MAKIKKTSTFLQLSPISYVLIATVFIIGIFLGSKYTPSSTSNDPRCWVFSRDESPREENSVPVIAENICTDEQTEIGKAELYADIAVSEDYTILVYAEPGIQQDPLLNIDDAYKYKYQNSIVVYSIAEQKEIARVSLAEIQEEYPDFIVEKNASLKDISISQSNTIAVNYGYALEPDAGSDIIVYDYIEDTFKVLDEVGVIREFFGNGLMLIERPDPNRIGEGQFYPTVSETIDTGM